MEILYTPAHPRRGEHFHELFIGQLLRRLVFSQWLLTSLLVRSEDKLVLKREAFSAMQDHPA
jgi:hypothetical protein